MLSLISDSTILNIMVLKYTRADTYNECCLCFSIACSHCSAETMICNKACSSTQLGSIYVVAMICVFMCMLVVDSHVCVDAIMAQVEPAICGQQMRICGLADFSAHQILFVC